MKLLKQRFSQWYNTRTGREGTLWENRFKSVLVDSAGRALVTMAAYIDLNCVRACLAKDPKDYRWCGYGEAVAGVRAAQLGIQRIVEAFLGQVEGFTKSLEVYRMRLFLQSASDQYDTCEREDQERRRAQVMEVLEKKGKLPLADYLLQRVRYFNDGVVFGTREFVNQMFEQNKQRFGKKRKSGARKMRGLAHEDQLYALRDLQVKVFG